MRISCAQAGVLLLCILCAWGWIAKKCMVLDESEEKPEIWNCVAENYTADCQGITDMSADLVGVPHHVQTMCISIKPETSGALVPNLFSQFYLLGKLHIFGCLTEIVPGTFRGLTNLLTLSLILGACSHQMHFNLSIESNVFSHLPQLKQLCLDGFAISTMSPDIFREIPQTEELHIQENYIQDLSQLLCKIINMTSLKTLVIGAQRIPVLKYQNCSSDGTLGKFYDLKNVWVNLGGIKLLDHGALEYFKDLTHITISSDKTMLTQLQKSGIKKILALDYSSLEKSNLESICELVPIFAIEYIRTSHTTFSNSGSKFKKCSGLKYLILHTPFIEKSHIELDFLHVLKNLSVLTINEHVGTSGLNFICKSQSDSVTWLTSLNLKENHIDSILAKQFHCLVNLEYLDLSYNSISTIEEFSFEGLVRLQTLDLSNNKISMIKTYTFFELISLTSLSLDENQLVHIEDMSFKRQDALSELILGGLNFYSTQSMITLNLTSIFSIFPSNLSHLHISSGTRPMHLIIGSDSTPKPGLTLSLKGKIVSFQDCERPFFQSVLRLVVNAEQFLCGSHFMGKYFRLMEDFEYRSSLEASLVDLVDLNQLIKLRRLRLISVDLSQQPLLQIMFHNLTNLEILILDNCRLHSLEGALTKDLISLKTLMITIANTFNVNSDFPEPMTNLRHVFFFDSKLFCNCENAWMLDWVQKGRLVEVFMSNPAFEDMSCHSEHGKLNFLKYAEAACSFDLGKTLFLLSALGLLSFMLAVLFYSLAGPYLLALFHIACGWLAEAARRGGGTGRFRFDAFVSYSGRDERWVVEELLPNLERRGPPFLRLCLHSRDFQLGKDILDNITDSLYGSRRTLCLVSRHYLRSNWCSLELRLATHRLLAEHKDVLILVFLEKIPPFQLSAHHRMARLVKTRTYLDWPQDQRQRLVFWDRLWAKLAPLDGGM